MRLKKLLWMGAVVILLPIVVFGAEAEIDEGADEAGKPTLVAVPNSSKEELEGDLKKTLQDLSVLHLQMMNLVPGAPQSTLEELVNKLMEVSCNAAAAQSSIGSIAFRCSLDYYLQVRGIEDEQALKLREKIAKLDQQLQRQAVNGDSTIKTYLKNMGRSEGVADDEITPVESDAYKEALKIIAKEDEWSSKTDDERLCAMGDLTKTDPKVWDLVLSALEPDSLNHIGLRDKTSEARGKLLEVALNQKIPSGVSLHLKALVGDFGGAPFRNFTSYLGVDDLPSEFNSADVSLTCHVDISGQTVPVFSVLGSRLQNLFLHALNGNKTAQDLIKTYELIRWWQNKRKTTELSIIQESSDNETIKLTKTTKVENFYALIEEQLLAFWNFLFPLTRVM